MKKRKNGEMAPQFYKGRTFSMEQRWSDRARRMEGEWREESRWRQGDLPHMVREGEEEKES